MKFFPNSFLIASIALFLVSACGQRNADPSGQPVSTNQSPDQNAHQAHRYFYVDPVGNCTDHYRDYYDLIQISVKVVVEGKTFETKEKALSYARKTRDLCKSVLPELDGITCLDLQTNQTLRTVDLEKDCASIPADSDLK